MNANGQAEARDQVAFVGMTSSITRRLVDPAQSVSTADTGSDSNRTTVRTASVSTGLNFTDRGTARTGTSI
jgi:hypothetical protein